MNSEEIIQQLEVPVTGLDLEVLRRIHRGIGGFIGFFNKKEGAFKSLFAIETPKIEIPVKDLPLLYRDSYFTVNGAYQAGQPKSSSRWRYPFRRESSVRWLNACYVDCDVGRPNSNDPTQRATWQQTVRGITELIQANLLPPFSIIGRSGRGVYVFWLLRETDPNLPVRAWPDALALYKQINKSLQQRLSHWACFEKTDDEVGAFG